MALVSFALGLEACSKVWLKVVWPGGGSGALRVLSLRTGKGVLLIVTFGQLRQEN